jgi:hypothetical protein
MKLWLLLLGVATPSAASCGLDLNAVYNGSQPLTLYFPAQVIWTPHFKLQVGGQSIADFDTLCPRWTRNMEMTTPDGGLVMRTEADFGIFTSWFTSGSVVNVYDCNNQYLGQVVETFADTFVNSFAFSNNYRVVDAGGNTIGTTSGQRFYNGLLSVASTTGPTSGQVVGTGTWSWPGFTTYSDSNVAITQWTPGTAARAEFMVALMSIGYLRFLGGSKGGGVQDQCSRFVITGTPVLALVGGWCCGRAGWQRKMGAI